MTLEREDMAHKEDSDRQRLLNEIGNIWTSLNEDMSIRQVELFFARQVQRERLQAIIDLSDATGVPIATMEQRSCAEHNVIHGLILADKIDDARSVALDPEGARQSHADLFEEAERFVQTQRVLPGGSSI